MFNIGKAFSGLQLSSALTNALMGVPSDQRKEFCAILIATAASAAEKQNFNIETEINDLWIRLRNIQSSSNGGGVGGILGQMSSELNNSLLRAIQSLTK